MRTVGTISTKHSLIRLIDIKLPCTHRHGVGNSIRSYLEIIWQAVNFYAFLFIQEVIAEKFSVAKEKLRIYIHYQPTFYHLHVHFNVITHEASGKTAPFHKNYPGIVVKCRLFFLIIIETTDKSAFHMLPVYLNHKNKVNHTMHFSGSNCEKAYLLRSVIDNLENYPTYYQKATLTCVVSEGQNLCQEFVKKGTFCWCSRRFEVKCH